MSLKSLQFQFMKVEATGNDFILVDLLDPKKLELWERELGKQSRPEFVKEISDRHFGLGADGVVFLESSQDADFVWDFYNSDGGSAEMCGNAARAVSLYVHLLYGRRNLKFKTRVGMVNATIHSSTDIEVELPPIREQKWAADFDYVNSGVPHVVVKAPDIRDLRALREIALTHKRRPEFLKDGTNVTFVRSILEHQIESVTFERGVEDFTLACGTGAIAAAHSILRGQDNNPVKVAVPGGVLSVVFKNGRPFLRGPARIVGEMRWIKE